MSSTEILLPKQKVISVGTEVRPVNSDFPHGHEVVSPGGERAGVDKERVCVMFSSGRSRCLSQFGERGLTELARRRLRSGGPRPVARRVSSVCWSRWRGQGSSSRLPRTTRSCTAFILTRDWRLASDLH